MAGQHRIRRETRPSGKAHYATAMLRPPQWRQSAIDEPGPGESGPSPAGRGRLGPDAAEATARRGSQGLSRSIRLFRLFLREQTEPELFYSGLAEDAADQLASCADLAGRTVVDVGGGAGHFTAAFRARGADSFIFEPDRDELLGRGSVPRGAVLADGYWLPVADASADICFSSNVLEHVSDPAGLIEEMIRVTKPGGVIYLSFTNWYSPWGGHEMSPWHLLGAGFAARRYVRRYGRQPKHTVGRNLFPVHVGPILRLMRSRSDVAILAALPRYYPRWCRVVLRIPLLREITTWNLLVIVRRKA
jgi:SAM-dependent methyltransferase